MLRSLITLAYCFLVISAAPVNELLKGISNFSSDLYRQSANSTSDNVIISPYSVINVLALLAQAAECNTLDELKTELHLYGDKASVAEQFHILYKLLQKSAGNSTFLVANQIYVQQDRSINKRFQEVAVQKFSSGIETVNFANGLKAAEIINRFVGKKTNGKINGLVTPDAFSPITQAILVNAIYFRSDWKYKFEEAYTIEEDFYTSKTERVAVDFMNIKEQFYYGDVPDLDATALEMKYANSNFTFIAILPNNRTGLSALESKMTEYNLATVTSQMSLQEVDVKLPKFKIEFEIKLMDVLKNLGITEIFTPQAELNLLETGESLQVADVIHKAFIEVNERGSEAAAATAALLTFNSLNGGEPQLTFHANHGFVFYIWNESTKTTVFSGRITKFDRN
ncbi:antichymotrypsin-2-like [Sitodiplosis mosellana]|uniref:antichymotrypsin-2-like n=1 Tax=Sitodiplosis mosellana TaxID=263140 RepID=UPI00244496DC|nr:antichymotrypsin-2-like [Sitodiplosis mosellana]